MNSNLITFLKKKIVFLLKSTTIMLEFVFAFVLGYLTIAFVTMSISVGGTEASKEEAKVDIFIKSDGIHTDFIFPVQSELYDWRTLFPPTDTKFKCDSLKYLAVGYGDRGFFFNTPVWAELKMSTLLNACFYLGGTALHTNYINDLDMNYEHIKIAVNEEQYKALIAYVKTTLILKENKPNCIPNHGYWDNDTFYDTHGSYGLFNTCNSWVNGGLKSADLPACLWTPMDKGIFHKY